MKKPRDLADRMSKSATGLVHETIMVQSSAAQKRTKELFEQFPSRTYLTEIVSWKSLGGGVVELTVKRLNSPIDQEE